jgi:hypothetical protein
MRTLLRPISIVFLTSLVLVSCGKGGTADQSVNTNPPIPTEKGSQTPKAPAVVEKPRSFDEVLAGLSKDVKDSNTFRICAAQSVDSCEAMAITEKAREKSDIAICDEMKSVANRNACKSSLVEESVRKSGNASECAKLETGKENCQTIAITAKAMKTNDSGACAALQSKDAASNAFDLCVLQTVQANAKSDEDLKTCDKISSDALQASCENFVRSKAYLRK